VPLRTQVKNGETVEVITAKSARPNPAWVNFVATAKARSSIRQYLKNLRQGEARELGRRLLDHALRDFGSALRKVDREPMARVLNEFGLNNTNELFEQIGLGERLSPVVAQVLLQSDPGTQGSDGSHSSEGSHSSQGSDGRAYGTATGAPVPTPITIAGTEGLVVSYSRCCHPLPGDEIMGYLSAGRGVVIHRNVCGNLSEYRKQPHKWIAINWQSPIEREFSSEIKVEVANQPGVLAEVAAKIGEASSNIEQVSVDERHEDTAELLFLILVRDRVHLAQVIRNIRSMQSVKRVTRTCA
jgi:(p)ppGpp synthase/HD superfamily hydrolase